MTLGNLGGARVGLGEYVAAEADLRQSLAMVGTAGNRGLSETYRFLAEACLGQGKVTEALEAAQRALASGQETNMQEGIGGAWRTLGKVLEMRDGKLDKGTAPNLQHPTSSFCFAESLRIFTESGMEAERARTLRDWARYELAHGDQARGEAMWQEARAIFERLNLPLLVAEMEAV